MASINIPAALNGLRALRAGFQMGERPVLESQVDRGPPKQRRLSTAGARPVSVVFRMTRAVYADDFLPFFQDTLKDGALWFNWTEPLSGAAVEAQFVGGSPPVARPVAGGRVHVAAQLRVKG